MGALFLIALLSVSATIYYSFAGMRQVIAESMAYGDNQGHQLAKDSRKALRTRIETDLADSAADQARIIGLIQENIAGAVNGVIDDVMAGRLYWGKGDPEQLRVAGQIPGRPEQFALCHFAPGVPQNVRNQATLKKLAAAFPFLYELSRSSPFIESSAVILPDGIQIFHPWRNLPADYDARSQNWYREVLAAKGKIHWSKVREGVMVCGRAAYSDSRLLGVIAAEIPVNPVSGQVTAIRSGYLSFLTSSDGRILSGDKEFAALSGSAEELKNYIRSGKKGVFQLKGEDGPLLAACAPVPECGWKLVICQPESLALKSIADMEKRLKTDRETAQAQFEGRISQMTPGYILIIASLLLLLLLLGYLLARQLTRPISTLMESAHAIGSGHLDNKIHLHTGDELEQLANTVNQMADDLKRYIKNLNQAASDRQRVEAELRTAAAIQADMLPKEITGRSDIDICAVMKPAREVGGDLYDYVFIDPTHLFFVIGDVSGKGIPAALFMATAKTLMRGFARNALSPAEILQQTNNYLEEENDNCMFITVCCGLLDCVTGEVVCCNAGHNLPVYLHADGNSSLLKLPAGFPLGPFHQDTPEFYTEERLQLKPGDALVLYTDGITEAMNADHEQFGSGRLQLALSAAAPGKGPLKKTMDSMLNIVKEHVGDARQSDDLTVLMVQYKGVAQK
jgi:sigma-B regulation protein RsbU (phosphoserine phosphatase)